ncbi:DNA-methyltransferase [Lacticaseibacillus paracasei]|uniref:DNA-methyltransferase n=1 Tax=Lacticaseibacillus paracasei TaxID=1597 RepID=UPI001F508549|nr:DNA methyltransferase [Lacticaseibacillus paracasei]MCI0374960.1 site-specific DNA-methyltransferase [Lacticaseibacillus paracasei]
MKSLEIENAKTTCELFNDHFQNYKRYGIPKAQLVIADIPYNVGNNAYGSNPTWYVGGNDKNGTSDKAGKTFFDTDVDFRVAEFMHFCSHMLVKEPRERGKAPAMIVFCAFQQMQMVIEYGQKYGFHHNFPLIFIKNQSAQALKANMRIVGATEYAVVLYRDKLPKFNNDGQMIFNWFPWDVDNRYPKIHPTQKPIPVLKRLIGIFTDPGDVVIDPCAGSGSTLRAAAEMSRNAYGFEIKKDMYKKSKEKMLSIFDVSLFGG